MSKLPQVNVRLTPEHHDLIRSIAARVRTDPGFAKSLALMLDSASPRLEGTSPWLARFHDLEARMAALEERASAPVTTGSKKRSPPPWTDADDAELHRIFDQGGTQADACWEMDRPADVIDPKWRDLIEEKVAKAEAALMPLEQTRQIDAMMKAGKSGTEIVEAVGLPIPSMKEIK
jgi:hypothetical protein